MRRCTECKPSGATSDWLSAVAVWSKRPGPGPSLLGVRCSAAAARMTACPWAQSTQISSCLATESGYRRCAAFTPHKVAARRSVRAQCTTLRRALQGWLPVYRWGRVHILEVADELCSATTELASSEIDRAAPNSSSPSSNVCH